MGQCAWCYDVRGVKKPRTETDSNWDPSSPTSKKRMLDAAATPQSGSSTHVGSPEVREVHPPTPGSRVTRDPEHAYMPTPSRTGTTTSTPSDEGKKPGEREGYPINLG